MTIILVGVGLDFCPSSKSEYMRLYVTSVFNIYNKKKKAYQLIDEIIIFFKKQPHQMEEEED